MMLNFFFKRMRPLWVVLSLFALAFTTASCQRYDVLINKDQIAAEKWSNLESQLQRRSDLIPNLVSVAKGSAKYEQDTLTKVTEARSQLTRVNLTADDLGDPEKMAAFQKAQSQLSGALSKLMMVQEQYPELKANQAFHDLQVQIEGTENPITPHPTSTRARAMAPTSRSPLCCASGCRIPTPAHGGRVPSYSMVTRSRNTPPPHSARRREPCRRSTSCGRTWPTRVAVAPTAP